MEDISKTVILEKGKGYATISLNRPPANSYYKDFLQHIGTLTSQLESDPSIKIVLLDSRSEKFFCAGADIKIFSANTVEENDEMVLAARALSNSISNSSKIYIAAIRGHILGGGLELAMACDIRLAAEGKYLVGLPEVKLGLMPGNGGTPRMIDLLGASRAMEMLVTGNNITPQKAYDFGLFNQLYPSDTFTTDVDNYIASLAKGAGKAMSAIKQYVKAHKGMSTSEALDHETNSVKSLYDTPDAKEGFLAFVEKREPQYE